MSDDPSGWTYRNGVTVVRTKLGWEVRINDKHHHTFDDFQTAHDEAAELESDLDDNLTFEIKKMAGMAQPAKFVLGDDLRKQVKGVLPRFA